MDEEKKSEASQEDVERLGPYRLHEQVPQDEHSRDELYLATHETTGTPALVLKPAEDGSKPPPDVQGRYISSSSPAYVAVEVEQTPWAVAPDKHSVETVVCTFEDVRAGMERLAQALSGAPEPRPLWRLGLALTGAAAVCALVFALGRLAPVSPPPVGPEALASAEHAPMSPEVPADTWGPLTEMSFLRTTDGGLLALSRPLPSKPYPGQKRPPCKARVEVELNGGCWVPHKEKAPCPEDLFESKGECYTVSGQPPPLPQSLGE